MAKEFLQRAASTWRNSFSPQLCPGCGLGSTFFALLEALEAVELKPAQLKMIIGTGCLYPLGQKLGQLLPLKVVHNGRLGEALWQELLVNPLPSEKGAIIVLMNNLDLFLSGGEDWLALIKEREGDENRARSLMKDTKEAWFSWPTGRPSPREINMPQNNPLFPLVVIHFNNCLFTSRDSCISAATPLRRMSVTGEDELPFNLPLFFARLQPELLARWTPLQVGWFRETLKKALLRPAFSFVEVVLPCVVWEVEENRCLSASERFLFYDQWTEFYSGQPLQEVDLRQNQIIVGEIVNRLPSPRDHRKKAFDDNWSTGEAEIFLESEKCQGCGICLEVCQTGVLAWAETKNKRGYSYPVALHPEKCLVCGLCEMFCPELAIKVERRGEVSKKEQRL
ncbi:MAG: hypothetical protein DRI99_05025 [Candidatus Aminicenantes bacterium]|nr:MAG: hypothetical protein DRI99_05025 [Candidatus Aminicenantes bacterium]